MNTKIKLSMSVFVVFIALFGLFAIATPASAMTCNSATIDSTVSTYSSNVSAYFTYGTNYNQVALGEGVTTPPQTIAPNSYIEQLLTGLSENTTYYYKLIVAGQKSATDVNNFTTPSCNTPAPTPVNQTPTVTLTANPSSIQYGGNSTLSWYSTNATSCSAYWTSSTATSGSGVVNPTTTTTYSITCTNSSGQQASSSATVSVNQVQNNPPTVNIYANPTSISYGGSSTITWNSYNANYCSITGGNNNGLNGNQTSGSFNSGILYSTTTYNIICTNSSGQQANGSATVYVSGQSIYQPVYQPPVVYPTYQPPVYQQPVETLTAVTTPATQVLATSARLNSVISDGGNNPINAWFEWGTTINLGNRTTTAAVGSLPSVIHTDMLNGLEPGTTYYFRAVAENSSLRSVGSILCFTTNGAQVIRYTPVKKGAPLSSLLLITSSVNRNQPIVTTIDNTRPHPGDEINYTVNYQNVGNAAATNLSLQVVLPQQVDYISSTPVNPNNFGNTLTFNLGTLRANGQGQVTVKVRVQDNATPGTNLDFPAVLSYVNASGQPQSVTADVSAQVWGEANNTSSTGTNIFGFGSGFLPTSIFGWLILIIFILLLIWLAKYIYNKSSQPWKNNTSQSAPVVYHQPQPWDTTAPTMPNTPAPFNSSPLRKRTTTIVEE